MNPVVPDVTLPHHEGQRYQALVPDTLDLQERAALAVHGLTGPAEPEFDYEIPFYVYFLYNPPVMVRMMSDHVIAKFVEAMPLMRLMSGSDLNRHVEQRWLEVIIQSRLPGGAIATPVVGRPWMTRWQSPYSPPRPLGDQTVDILINGRYLAAITAYSHVVDRALWEEVGRGIVSSLRRLVVDRGDFAYLARVHYDPDEVADPSESMPKALNASYAHWPAQALVQFARVMSDEPALELAGKIYRGIIRHGDYFDAEGRWLTDRDGERQDMVHFHAHSMVLLGALQYALLAGDRETIDFVVRSYAHARAQGEPLTGFFPENVVAYGEGKTCELCCVADMVDLALRLAAAGLGDDYWDDADRYVRNHLVEGQLVRADWVGRQLQRTPPSKPPPHSTTDRVAERNVGAFAGNAGVNEWVDYASRAIFHWRVPMDIQHCCTGNGTRALYYAWEHILHYDAATGKLRVNLLLNRASPWADIGSHIPYVGQVDVKVKQPVELSIRIPEWVEAKQVWAEVNGESRNIGFEGRYAGLGGVKPGDVAVLRFPIAEREDVIAVDTRVFALVRKGNDVVAIDPPGVRCPIYQRDHYRAEKTRWRTIERFVADQVVAW